MATHNSTAPSGRASLQVASASLTLITVNGKQMTLSVFRQLVERCPFRWNESQGGFVPLGELWGTVNYHWKECPFEDGQMAEHRHVVWCDEDGQLRRFAMRNNHWCGDEAREEIFLPWGIILRRYRQDQLEKVHISSDPAFDGQNMHAPQVGWEQQKKVLKHWFAAYDTVLELPQLFIAV